MRQERAQDRQAAEQTRQFDKTMAQRESEFGRDQSLKAMIASDQLAAAEHRLLLSEGGAMARQEKAAADNILMQNDAQEAAEEAASALAASNEALAQVRNAGQLAVQGLANQGAKERDEASERKLDARLAAANELAVDLEGIRHENAMVLAAEEGRRRALLSTRDWMRRNAAQEKEHDFLIRRAGAAGEQAAASSILQFGLQQWGDSLDRSVQRDLEEALLAQTASVVEMYGGLTGKMATTDQLEATIPLLHGLAPDPVIFNGINVPTKPAPDASEAVQNKYKEDLLSAVLRYAAANDSAARARIEAEHHRRAAASAGIATAIQPIVSRLGPGYGQMFAASSAQAATPLAPQTNTTTVAPPNPSVGGGTKLPTYTPPKTVTPLNINLGLPGGTSQP